MDCSHALPGISTLIFLCVILGVMIWRERRLPPFVPPEIVFVGTDYIAQMAKRFKFVDPRITDENFPSMGQPSADGSQTLILNGDLFHNVSDWLAHHQRRAATAAELALYAARGLASGDMTWTCCGQAIYRNGVTLVPVYTYRSGIGSYLELMRWSSVANQSYSVILTFPIVAEKDVTLEAAV